jgi:hypothetical protein
MICTSQALSVSIWAIERHLCRHWLLPAKIPRDHPDKQVPGRECGAVPHQDRHSLRSEVPIRVAILYESARYSRHRAVNDFLYNRRDLELR